MSDLEIRLYEGITVSEYLHAKRRYGDKWPEMAIIQRNYRWAMRDMADFLIESLGNLV